MDAYFGMSDAVGNMILLRFIRTVGIRFTKPYSEKTAD